jgi:hypothetical protein
MKYVLLALLAVGCKDRSPPKQDPPPPDPRIAQCTAALASFDHFVETPDVKPDDRAKIKQSVIDRCIADKWPDAALACMRAAQGPGEVFKCWNEQLTKEQRDAVTQAFRALAPKTSP